MERAGVRGVLKGEKVGNGGEFARDCRFETNNFRHTVTVVIGLQ